MSRVENAAGVAFGHHVPVLIIGGGAAGMVAALSVVNEGIDALVVERDPVPRGSTALSAGLVPAAGTRWQTAAGVYDDPDLFASDILRKAHREPDRAAVATVANAIGPVLEWLTDAHGLEFSLITNFSYPGHSAYRMHGLPSRSGEELIDRLRTAAERAGVALLAPAQATTLYAAQDGRIAGVGLVRPDGSEEKVGCDALVLACNGYGGNRDLVRRHIPDLADALYFGHAGNQGDALLWGETLGAATRHLAGHQGHGSVAHPHGILITWATITEGGFQVNARGKRFHDESRGYSEAAVDVVRQPDHVAVTIFDERIAEIARQFEDFRKAEASGAIVTADTLEALEARFGLPPGSLATTAADIASAREAGGRDGFGRDWSKARALAPPYRAVRVTGTLFHTQGGLVVDSDARVQRPGGRGLPNLFAAGGAACGVSGGQASGYLSGNGLLTALAYGHLAGRNAARLIAKRPG